MPSPHVIYDVGAGDGHVARALEDLGLRVIALDLYPHEGAEVAVLPWDGTTCTYLENSCVMLCRPCYGAFVQGVIANALRCNVRRILYVGKYYNVDLDLGLYATKFRAALQEAGEDGEVVMVHDRDPPKEVLPVALVAYEGWGDAYWRIDRTDHWENILGGRCPKRPNDRILETSTVTEFDFEALDWSRSGYVKKEGDHCWLSPEGAPTFCDYAEHDVVARYILKQTPDALTSEGWIRVNGKGCKGRMTFSCPKKDPTPAQKAWLVANGHDLDPYGLAEDATPEARAVRAQEEEQNAFQRYVSAAEKTTGKKLKK